MCLLLSNRLKDHFWSTRRRKRGQQGVRWWLSLICRRKKKKKQGKQDSKDNSSKNSFPFFQKITLKIPQLTSILAEWFRSPEHGAADEAAFIDFLRIKAVRYVIFFFFVVASMVGVNVVKTPLCFVVFVCSFFIDLSSIVADFGASDAPKQRSEGAMGHDVSHGRLRRSHEASEAFAGAPLMSIRKHTQREGERQSSMALTAASAAAAEAAACLCAWSPLPPRFPSRCSHCCPAAPSDVDQKAHTRDGKRKSSLSPAAVAEAAVASCLLLLSPVAPSPRSVPAAALPLLLLLRLLPFLFLLTPLIAH